MVEGDYFQSLTELAELGAVEVLSASDAESVRSILSILAIAKDLRVCGNFLALYSEDELLDMKRKREEVDP